MIHNLREAAHGVLVAQSAHTLPLSHHLQPQALCSRNLHHLHASAVARAMVCKPATLAGVRRQRVGGKGKGGVEAQQLVMLFLETAGV